MIKNIGLKSLSGLLGLVMLTKAGTMLILPESELAEMRFILQVQMSDDADNKLMQTINPEAAYFIEAGSERTIVLRVTMVNKNNPIPLFAELLYRVSAKADFHPAMLLEDLKRAFQSTKREGRLQT